jgi:hypothetical protein
LQHRFDLFAAGRHGKRRGRTEDAARGRQSRQLSENLPAS